MSDPRMQRQITERIAALQTKGDSITRATIIEQQRMTQLDRALQEAEESIKYFRTKTKSTAVEVLNLNALAPKAAYKDVDGVNPTRQADSNQKKLVGTLESKLDKLRTRQSETSHNIQKLKKKIDDERSGRVTANAARAKYEARIRDIRSRIAEAMARSAELSENIEKLTKEREGLLASNMEEAQAHEEHIRMLDEAVALQDEKFEESVQTAASRSLKASEPFADIPQAGQYTAEEGKEIKRRYDQLDEDEKKEEKAAIKAENRLEWLNKAFDELKKASDVADMDRLVGVFMKVEEDNFSQFNYFRTVNQEVDELEEKIEQLKAEMRKYEEEQKVEEEKRARIINDLKQQVQYHATVATESEEKAAEDSDMVKRVSKEVKRFFFKMKCDKYLQNELKGGHLKNILHLESLATALSTQGITETHLLDVMSLLEQQAIQIAFQYTHPQIMKDSSTATVFGPSSPPAWECRTPVVASMKVEYGYCDGDVGMGTIGEDEDLEKPVNIEDTRQEMQQKMANGSFQSMILNRASRREKTILKKGRKKKESFRCSMINFL